MGGVNTFWFRAVARLAETARAFLIVLAAFCACSPAGAFDQKILLVAGDENFPPYEFVDVIDGESVYRGFNVDLLKAVALTTGYEIRFVPMPWSDALRALERGEVDAIGGMKYDRGREKIYDFSEPYMQNSLAIFVRTSMQAINSLDDLGGRKVAVQQNDAAHDRLKNRQVHLLPTLDQKAALELLLKGEAEAVLGNRLTGEYLLQRLGRQEEVKIVGGQIDTERYGVAVRKGDPRLATFNQGLSQIRANGTYAKVYEKWFGEMMGRPAQYYKRNLGIALGVAGVLLVAAAVVVAFNVSLKREVRKQVREIREYSAYIEGVRRYQSGLLNSGYGGIVTLGGDGAIKFANRYAERYLGAEEGSLAGRLYGETPLAGMLGAPERAAGRPNARECTLGGVRVEYVVDELDFAEGKDTIVHFRDVTEEKKLRQELARKDKLEALGKLLASIAHEIRNPLTSIKTFVELLPAKYDNPDFRQKISRLVPEEVERLDAIVGDLLAYAHTRPAAPESIRLRALLNDTLVFFAHTIGQENVRLSVAVDDSCVVRADPHQLRQVLINVILNALQALQGREAPELALVSARHAEGLALSVRDNGPGIDKEHLEHIFEPFFSTKTGGTGLGLFISHELAALNRIRMEVFSEENRGTEIRLTFLEEPDRV